jgi:hypothetical protein
VSGTFNYATGQAYTRPEQRYELVDSPFSFSPGVGGAQNVLVSPFNNARLPPYHRLDVGVARTGQFFGMPSMNCNCRPSTPMRGATSGFTSSRTSRTARSTET